MTLTKQIAYFKDAALKERIEAAVFRHAVFLVTKASPTAAEIAWRDAILGQRYDDVSLLGRCRIFACSMPSVYNAASAAVGDVTDAILMAIVPDMPNAIKP